MWITHEKGSVLIMRNLEIGDKQLKYWRSRVVTVTAEEFDKTVY
jgi:hypothetical protein